MSFLASPRLLLFLFVTLSHHTSPCMRFAPLDVSFISIDFGCVLSFVDSHSLLWSCPHVTECYTLSKFNHIDQRKQLAVQLEFSHNITYVWVCMTDAFYCCLEVLEKEIKAIFLVICTVNSWCYYKLLPLLPPISKYFAGALISPYMWNFEYNFTLDQEMLIIPQYQLLLINVWHICQPTPRCVLTGYD